ncbi:MAG: aminotransferase class I/II-fold pyridoxal phosphate-dependent enzyme [Gammaproteobacteria bacterium]|nr:aminotransferase class I/II-fold pyridoxal phosphate-dependent enzyme [Gammaproteobacteria bacterium]
MKSKLRRIGLTVENNDLPIVSWTVGDATVMSNIQKALFKQKIAPQYCHYIGTGEQGVLRAVVFSTHTEEQIDFFVDHLKSLL